MGFHLFGGGLDLILSDVCAKTVAYIRGLIRITPEPDGAQALQGLHDCD